MRTSLSRLALIVVLGMKAARGAGRRRRAMTTMPRVTAAPRTRRSG